MQKPSRPNRARREPSEKQLQALADNQHIGSKLRSLMCVVAMSSNNMSGERARVIRELVDNEMHDMGYESYTEQRDRLSKYFETYPRKVNAPNSFFKLQKRENLPKLKEKYLGGSNES